jgi:hypothetical protein
MSNVIYADFGESNKRLCGLVLRRRYPNYGQHQVVLQFSPRRVEPDYSSAFVAGQGLTQLVNKVEQLKAELVAERNRLTLAAYKIRRPQ